MGALDVGKVAESDDSKVQSYIIRGLEDTLGDTRDGHEC